MKARNQPGGASSQAQKVPALHGFSGTARPHAPGFEILFIDIQSAHARSVPAQTPAFSRLQGSSELFCESLTTGAHQCGDSAAAIRDENGCVVLTGVTAE